MSRVLPAEQLRLAMVARGWTKTDLAREAGINIDTVAQALDPDADLKVATENKIVEAIGRTKDQIRPDAAAGLRELAEGAA